jgi:SAM-dependent methyltransferase
LTDSAHTTPDGSPVAVYLALPAGPAPTMVHEAIGDGATVLELGSGVGRMTRVLVAYGHQVVTVDNDPVMLEHVTGAEAVCADIETLDLDRSFDAVVAASHLISSPDPANRIGLLTVCRRHSRSGGSVLVERYPPDWAADPVDTESTVGPVQVSIRITDRTRAGFAATAEYRLGSRRWLQPFTGAHVDDHALAGAAHTAGLEFVGWLDEARTWGRLVRPAGLILGVGRRRPVRIRQV